MNTMADLRVEVSNRLHDTLHGREIDTLEMGMPEIEHMLGIVTIGAISTEKVESGTILDPSHEFWQSYYQDINTKTAARDEIETAMQSLKDDGILVISAPYGDDAGIMYVEVERIDSESNEMVTECAHCGTPISTEPELTLTGSQYLFSFDLDCPSCDFNETLSANMGSKL